jgi:iron complex outermembrane recepter protein
MRADYRITGPTWFHTVQDQTRATIFSQLLPISALALPGFVGNANYSVARRNAFGVLNLRFGLEGENWNLTAAIEFGGSFISPGARRLVGVELGYKF